MLNKGDVQFGVAVSRGKTLRPRKGVVLLAILAFPLFLSVGLDNFSPALDSVINGWKILSTVVVVLWYIHRMLSDRRASAHIIPMALVMLALLFSTLANSGSMERYLIVWGGFFAVGLLVEARIKENPLQLLLALKIVLGTIAVVNFLTVVALPGGLWSTDTEGYWLLGHRNNFGTPLIAAIVVSAAYDLVSRGRLTVTTMIIAVASFVSVTLTWSASSVLAVALTVGAVVVIPLSKKGISGLKPFLLLAMYVAVDIGIVIFQIQERASDFITNVLDRSADLTGRTRIWDIVFEMIQKSPFMGNGVQLTENNGLTIYDPNYVHAHNGELDILMQGGLFAFVPFVVMVILATRNASRFYSNRAVQIIFVGLILLMLRAITGLFFSSYTVLIVFLLLNSESIARLAGDLVTPRPRSIRAAGITQRHGLKRR